MKKVWVCVYRDTIEEHDKDWNLSEILTTEDFVRQYYEEYKMACKDCEVKNCEDATTFEQWYYDEYTADDTEDFYEYAKEHNAILEIKHWK